MTTGDKRRLVALFTVILLVIGLGVTAGTGQTQWLFSQGRGVVVASSHAAGLDILQAVLELLAKRDKRPNVSQLDVLLLQADEAWKANDWSQSVELLTSIVQMDPANAAMSDRLSQAHINAGWAHLADRQVDDARVEFEEALQVRPQSAEAQEGLRLLSQLVVRPGGGGVPPVVEVVPTSAPVPQAAVVLPTAVAQAVVVCPTAVALAIVVCPTVCPQVVVPVCPQVVVPVCPTVCPQVVVPVCPTVCPLACPQVSSQVVVKVHVVQRGDNIFRLATQFNTTVAVIMKANSMTSTTIRVGQTLVIP